MIFIVFLQSRLNQLIHAHIAGLCIFLQSFTLSFWNVKQNGVIVLFGVLPVGIDFAFAVLLLLAVLTALLRTTCHCVRLTAYGANLLASYSYRKTCKLLFSVSLIPQNLCFITAVYAVFRSVGLRLKLLSADFANVSEHGNFLLFLCYAYCITKMLLCQL